MDNKEQDTASLQFIHNDFAKNKTKKDSIIMLDNLDFNSWIRVIYSSFAVNTPECGCTHLASLCNNQLTVIYDPAVGPVLSNTSALSINILTGHEVFIDRSAATGSK